MRLRLLGPEECARLHAAALRLLAEVGVRVDDESARRLLKRAGCRESDAGRLLYPADLVQRTLQTIPRRFVLYDRNGEPAVDTADPFLRFAPGINCLSTLDWRTGEHRPCLLADIRETALLCKRLPNIDAAAEAIRRAAESNTFLYDEHTLAHMRQALRGSSLLHRESFEEWTREGRKTLQCRLREKVEGLLA